MDKFDFEKLEVYKKSLEFAGNIYDLFEKLPYKLQQVIGNNLLRAAMPIASNIAEGSGRRGQREKRQAFVISQGSAFECIPSLTLLHKKNIIQQNEFNKLYDDCYIISKMIGGLVKRFS